MIAFDGTNYMHSQTVTGSKDTPVHNSGKVFRTEKSERMGGSVPVWTQEKTSKEVVASRLALAERTGSTRPDGIDNALAYSPSEKESAPGDEFSFGDIVDMVNPLHHIPVVGSIYREISGDNIKPISKIIGGGVFGGAAGAASGLVNVIIEEETGKDIPGNVMSFAFKDGEDRPVPDKPHYRLDRTAKRLAKYGVAPTDLPGSAIAFADLGARRSAYEKVDAAEGRTSGSVMKQKELHYEYKMPREPITELGFSEMR